MNESNARRFSRSSVIILSLSAGQAASMYFAVRYLSGRKFGVFLLVAILLPVLFDAWLAVKRRRYRFGLSTLLSVMLGIGLVLGVFTSTMHRRRENLAAQRELASLGCRTTVSSYPVYRVVFQFVFDARARSSEEQSAVIRDIAVIYDYFTWHHPDTKYEFKIDVTQAGFEERYLRALHQSLPDAEITR